MTLRKALLGPRWQQPFLFAKTRRQFLLGPSTLVAYNVDSLCCSTPTPKAAAIFHSSAAPTHMSPRPRTLRHMLEELYLKAFEAAYGRASVAKQHMRDWVTEQKHHVLDPRRRRPAFYKPVLVQRRCMHSNSSQQQPMPHLPHRPSKAELMAQARGFLERWKIRIKYPLMRQMRPWTLNDITALFSWLFLGQSLWLLVGTTSFVSLILWTANSLQFQEWIAYRVGRYLTSATGAIVVFDSAILPNWKDGKIRFNHVHIYRMPRSEREKFERHALLTNDADDLLELQPVNDDDPLAGVHLDDDEKDNEVLRTHMWFDLKLDRVEVTLSLMRWMDGKGLVQSADVKGVRGVVDRRHVRWNSTYDPVAARHKYTPGDFELDKFTLEDLLVTVYQPNGFRPYPVSIFQAQLDKFRKQW